MNEILQTIWQALVATFTTWWGGIYVGGLIATGVAKKPWTWRGASEIAGNAIYLLFWPVWLAVTSIEKDEPSKF